MPDALPEVRPFIRQAHYYETDQMGVIHHANYIHWMEEARIDFMDQIGLSYRTMEQRGVASPVTAVAIEYKSPVHFDDRVEIRLRVTEYNSVQMKIAYRMTDAADGTLRTLATSTHCFIGAKGQIVALKRSYPDIDARFRQLLDTPPSSDE